MKQTASLALVYTNTSFQFNIPGLIRHTANQPRTFGTQIN